MRIDAPYASTTANAERRLELDSLLRAMPPAKTGRMAFVYSRRFTAI